MSRRARISILGFVSILCWAGVASAETMRCQSVNGNVNCAGSGAVSCQTINGKKVCTNGDGSVVQSFGGGTSSQSSGAKSSGGKSSDQTSDNDPAVADDDPDDAAPATNRHVHIRQQGPGGQTMKLDQNGSKLQLQTNRLSVDRE